MNLPPEEQPSTAPVVALQEPSPAPPALRPLPRAALTHWRQRAWIRTAVFTLIALIAFLVTLFLPGSGELPAPWLRGLIAAIIPTLSARWRVDATTIDYHHGVWWRTENTIPRSRVQHIEVSQGPLQRALGLASLIIFTAGEQLNSVTIGGLDAETARAIRSQLLERVTGHVV